MHRKSKKIVSIIIFVAIIVIFAVGYFLKSVTYKGFKDVSISYEEFEKNQEWRNDVLLSNDEIISINSYLYYTNVTNGLSVPLCTIPDCTHNTEECMAVFPFECNLQFTYCFSDKLYIGGYTYNEVCFYRSDIDGSNHEDVTSFKVDGEIYNIDFYAYESGVYIAVGVGDTSKVKVLENGFLSDAPIKIKLLYFDYDKGKIEDIYTFEQSYYQSYVDFRYIQNGKLYYDFCGADLPYEEMYDFDTGELIKPEYENNEFERVEIFDIVEKTISVATEYQYKDYTGCEDNKYYFLEYDKGNKMSGNIRVENYEEKTEESICIQDLKDKNFMNCSVYRIKEGFVVNEQKEDTDVGKMTFYQESGEQIVVIEDCSVFVIGEYQNIYLLGRNYLSESMVAYVEKENIKQLSEKVVYLWNEE